MQGIGLSIGCNLGFSVLLEDTWTGRVCDLLYILSHRCPILTELMFVVVVEIQKLKEVEIAVQMEAKVEVPAEV